MVELKEMYDGDGTDNHGCAIGENFNEGATCSISFTAPQFMQSPILIYYELTNFHQNHRNYYSSRDAYQLLGQVGNQDAVSAEACEPLNKLGDITLNPCGLIANTFFNDKYELTDGVDVFGEDLKMLETGIAWASDIEYLFAQPEGFEAQQCDACDDTCCQKTTATGEDYSCGAEGKSFWTDPDTGDCYAYHYPLDETTQYLYETYPETISPLEGVTNEHFIVWMRVATQSTFRKLYGWIDQDIPPGETITLQVQSNYVVDRFRGTKSIIISTNNIFGGKNEFFGLSLYGAGFFFLICGSLLALKQAIRPRKLGDSNYLHYKEE